MNTCWVLEFFCVAVCSTQVECKRMLLNVRIVRGESEFDCKMRIDRETTQAISKFVYLFRVVYKKNMRVSSLWWMVLHSSSGDR